jgi:hypothetical protein
MMSERQAAEVLGGRGLGREQARQLLLTGAAGTGLRVGRSTAYDDRLVRGLAHRPSVDLEALAAACPHGVHVARIRRGLPFHCDWPWSRQAETLATQPGMTPMTRALVVGLPIAAHGGLPWVATVSGFVVFAATATGARVAEDGRIVFDLAPPDAWRAAVERRWFYAGPGRHWFSWRPDRLTQ